MGREVKRVPLNFDWPLQKVWKGYINPLNKAVECKLCDGSGYSPGAKRLSDMWYGYYPFKPEDRGSKPFLPTDEIILQRAKFNVQGYPVFFGIPWTVEREANRLCDYFNKSWMHHLNELDVTALIKGNRLWDFTHTWTKEEGWKPKDPPYIPTPEEVNRWSLFGFGHDSCNQWVCVKAECKRLGYELQCMACQGEGELWPSQEAKEAYEKWERTGPPEGEGYQIWETVSEGSPISPVFATPEELAEHMVNNHWKTDDDVTYEQWLAFIKGPGWAPSFVSDQNGIHSGVSAIVDNLI